VSSFLLSRTKARRCFLSSLSTRRSLNEWVNGCVHVCVCVCLWCVCARMSVGERDEKKSRSEKTCTITHPIHSTEQHYTLHCTLHCTLQTTLHLSIANYTAHYTLHLIVLYPLHCTCPLHTTLHTAHYTRT
jgi:hypothetical protein